MTEAGQTQQACVAVIKHGLKYVWSVTTARAPAACASSRGSIARTVVAASWSGWSLCFFMSSKSGAGVLVTARC